MKLEVLMILPVKNGNIGEIKNGICKRRRSFRNMRITIWSNSRRSNFKWRLEFLKLINFAKLNFIKTIRKFLTIRRIKRTGIEYEGDWNC